jgi:hypothetical protein
MGQNNLGATGISPNYKGKNPIMGYQKNSSQNYGKSPAPALPYCSLCGSTTHTAVQGCPYMQGNGGQVIKVGPTQDTCTKCPMSVSPRLHHPEGLCPWRPTGPFASKN